METAAASHLHIVHSSATPSVAAQIQHRLKQAESALDVTASMAGELISKTLTASAQAGVHRVRVQKMLKQLTASIDHALEGQLLLQRYHQSCRTIAGELDLAELGWGDWGGSPPIGSDLSETMLDNG